MSPLRRHFHCHNDVPGVEKDELEVEAGAEHEHGAVEFDLGDGGRGQRVAHGDQTDVLVVSVVGRHVQRELADLQVAATVDHLAGEVTTIFTQTRRVTLR